MCQAAHALFPRDPPVQEPARGGAPETRVVLPEVSWRRVLRSSWRACPGGHEPLLVVGVRCGWKNPWPNVHVISRAFMDPMPHSPDCWGLEVQPEKSDK
jgi:hypothetical protein